MLADKLEKLVSIVCGLSVQFDIRRYPETFQIQPIRHAESPNRDLDLSAIR